MHRFTALLTCIDGRVLPTALDWVNQTHDVEHVDVITSPGMDGALADGTSAGQDALESLMVSMVAHGTSSVVVVGHDDCAGNPAEPDARSGIVIRAMERVARTYPSLVVRGLHVVGDGAGWATTEVLPATTR